RAVASEEERGAVELVCAGFRYRVHLSAAKTAELRGVAAGLNFEFLQRINVDASTDFHRARSVVVDAVQDELIGVFGAAACCEPAAITKSGALARHECTGYEICQGREIAAVQRQVDNFLVFDDRAQR